MRLITSEIGSALYKLVKQLARPLSAMLESISGAHLKTSTDLSERIQRINYRKKLLSFDVTSFFTKILVEEPLAVLKEVSKERTD